MAGALSAFVAALAVVAPQSALASWLGPIDLATDAAPSNSLESNARVAIDADGDATFVWARTTALGSRIQTRTRTASGDLGAIQTLSGPSASQPQVAVTPDGDAVFAWVGWNGTQLRVKTRTRSATGQLGAVQSVSRPDGGPEAPRVAVDADGNAAFAWTEYDASGNDWLEARSRSATGALGPVRRVSDTVPVPFQIQAYVDMDGSGEALLAWTQTTYDEFGEDGIGVVQTRRLRADGTLEPTRDLSAPRRFLSLDDVSVNHAGDAIFIWHCECPTPNRFVVRTLSAGGAVTPVQELSANAPGGAPAQVTMNDDGDSVMAWEHFVPADPSSPGADPCCYRIEARSRTSSGRLSAVQTLSPGSPDMYSPKPQIAADAAGNAVITWLRNGRVQARTRSATRHLGPVTTLSPVGRRTRFEAPVAVSPSGVAAVTWAGFNGDDGLVQAAIGP
jgi:hypothetical protein